MILSSFDFKNNKNERKSTGKRNDRDTYLFICSLKLYNNLFSISFFSESNQNFGYDQLFELFIKNTYVIS